MKFVGLSIPNAALNEMQQLKPETEEQRKMLTIFSLESLFMSEHF